MKTYKIVGKTNPWIAQRDITFNGKCEIIIENNLTLREAQKKLLAFFNEDFGTWYQNWGLVVCNHSNDAGSHDDGTRYYEYDSRVYRIEEIED